MLSAHLLMARMSVLFSQDNMVNSDAPIYDIAHPPRSESRKLADEFKSTFAREVQVHFVGVW